MKNEISPQLLWGAGIVLVLILGFFVYKYVIAPPTSTASATAPQGATQRAQMNRSMRDMRLRGELPNRPAPR